MFAVFLFLLMGATFFKNQRQGVKLANPNARNTVPSHSRLPALPRRVPSGHPLKKVLVSILLGTVIFKMAGKGDAMIDVSLNGTLEPASPSLQNCIKYSSTGKYFSVLCDFGVALILEIKGAARVYVSLKLEMKCRESMFTVRFWKRASQRLVIL